MESWYIYNKKQQKQYGPYSQTQIQAFVHNQKMDETCVASNNQKKWYNSQELTRIFSNCQQTKKIGKFEIIKELGRGGMGVVYHARDTFLKYECAVKFIRLDQGIDDHTTRRFITEAQSIAKLKHPNIIGIKELNSFVDAQGNHLYYFSMDYVKGISFDEYIAQKIPLKEKLRTFLDVCHGVAYAHKNNIIHRDLKPGNIIVSEEGVPIVLDFGLARNLDTTENVTKTGDIIGTPKYIAPEVMQGQKANASCDTYALGVILYEILTGFSPFTGENMIEILFQVSNTDPIPPSRVNSKIAKEGDIEVICLKCLEKKTTNRIPSVQFLSEELQCFLEGKPTQTKPPGTIRKSLLWLKKNKITAGLGVVVLVLILVYLDVNYRLHNAKSKELLPIENYPTVVRSQLSQFYEKYSSSKGVHSILKDIENKYRDVQQKMEDGGYKKILTNKAKDMQSFFDSTQNIMHYFLMPSLPKILSSLKLHDIKDIYQIEVSAQNDIAVISKERKLYFANIAQQKSGSILAEQNFLVADCSHFYFSADGKYLAILFRKFVTEDQNATKKRQFCQILDVKSRRVIKEEELKKGRVDGKFSPNARFFAYCDFEKGASVIDIYNRKTIKELYKIDREKKNTAYNFDFSVDSRYLSFRIYAEEYYVYDVQERKIQHLGHFDRDIFPIWKNNKLFMYTNRKLESYDVQSKKRQAYSFTSVSSETLKQSAISPSGDRLIWGTQSGVIEYVTLMPRYTAQVVSQRQTYSETVNISFINEHFFFTLDKENHFYLRDSFSRETIYHQPGVYYAFYDQSNKELVVVVAKNRQFYLERWKIPFVVKELLHPSKNTLATHNLITRAYVDEKYMSSDPCMFIKKNEAIDAVISPWHKGLSIWYKQGAEYTNFLTFSLLVDIWDVKVSNDYKWVAIVVHHKKLRQQSVIMMKSSELSQLNVQTSDKIIDGMKVDGEIIDEWLTDKLNREMRSIAFTTNNDLYFSQGEQLWIYSSKKVRKVCRVPRKIRCIGVHSTANLIVVGQEKNLFSIVDDKGANLYTPKLEESENIFDKAAWNSGENAMCAISGTEGQLYLVYQNEKNMWQHEQISVPGQKYQLSFSPNGKMLAIFTSVDTYIYLIGTKHLFPIFAGYHKNNGGNFCRDWKYAAFPTGQARMFLFDLNKLRFENYAHYFTENPTGNDKLWPSQIRDEFFEYIKNN